MKKGDRAVLLAGKYEFVKGDIVTLTSDISERGLVYVRRDDGGWALFDVNHLRPISPLEALARAAEENLSIMGPLMNALTTL